MVLLSFFFILDDSTVPYRTRELRVTINLPKKLKKYGIFCRRITTSCWKDDENNIIYKLAEYSDWQSIFSMVFTSIDSLTFTMMYVHILYIIYVNIIYVIRYYEVTHRSIIFEFTPVCKYVWSKYYLEVQFIGFF